ncbi:MAG: competence/damage-inducible protein A [Fimbriimonadia bacterium]|jgi:nicotinamide-nucleotide amidase
MNAEIVSVGTELLLGQIVDAHAPVLGRRLAEIGVGCTHRQTVGDNLQRVTDALRLARSRADVVITIGGLGPTEDDLTREGIAAAFGAPLVHDPTIEQGLRTLFEARGLRWVDSQLRQAMKPEGAEAIPNPNGTAPGLWLEREGKIAIAMPGPRGEFGPMLENHVLPRLSRLSAGVRIVSRVVRVVGIGESVVEEMVRPLLKSENPTIAPLAHLGEVHLRITARSNDSEEIERLLDHAEHELRAILGDAVYGVDETTLQEAVIGILRERNETLACAESCTGGGLGAAITEVPGSSDVFLGGFITYSNDLKQKLLGAPEEVLQRHGAVSEECARAMASGARAATGATWALSITGIAGPTGGTDEKPVGLVFIGIAGPVGVDVVRHRFLGGREDVRRRSRQAALTLLRAKLLEAR